MTGFVVQRHIYPILYNIILYCVVSCRVVSCRVVSCRVVSCRVVSCRVVSCLVLSCLVLSCLVLSCLVLSCLVLSCLVLSCLVLSCLVMSCHVMSCHVMSCHVMSCQVMSGHVRLYYVMLCYVMLGYVRLCYVMLCYVMLCYVMLCYVMLCYVMLCYVMLCFVVFCFVLLEISTKSHSNILENYMHFLHPMSTRVVGMLWHYYIILYYIIYTNHFTDVNRNLWRKAAAALPTITIRFSGAASLTGALVFWGGAWPVGHFLQCRVPAHRHLNLLQWEARGRLSPWVNLLCWRIWRSFSFLFHNSNCISCICWVINCSL